MESKPLVRVDAATAAAVCVRYSVKKDALARLREGMESLQFVESLMSGKLYLDGIDFMAHALPAREAIWWGCLCLQHACGDTLSSTDKAACRAVVQWVMRPGEENRVAVLAPGQAADPTSPAAALATAVYQSGGNVAAANAPPAASQPFASAKAVVGAVKTACSKVPALKIVETQRLFFELAISIAQAGSSRKFKTGVTQAYVVNQGTAQVGQQE